MNPRERFLAAMQGCEVDRTPLAHVSALVTVELQKSAGCWMPQVHHDAAQLVKLCGANHDVLGFDAVTFNINYFGEPAALGVEMDWGGRNQYPTYRSNPWVEAEDAVCPDDILDREPVTTYLEAARIAKLDYGDKCAVLGKIMGPFSMVLAMHGIENVMLDTADAPEKLVHFFDVAAEVLVKCANAQFEAGIDALAIGEGGAGANMMSPEMYNSMLLGVHQKMLERIDGPTVMHICGDITPRLAGLKEVGLDCFNFDWDIDPKRMVAAAAGHFRVMGNVNTSDLLLARPNEIKKQVIACLEAGVDIISPGCAISPDCPNENFRAMHDTIIKWHRDAGSQ